MRPIAALSAVFLAGVLATVIAYLQTPPQPLKIRADECEIDDKIIAYHCFKTTLNSMQDSLAKGGISLEDARDRVYESAFRSFPCYLSEIVHCEQGTTPQERVARNLIGHLRMREEFDPTLYVRVFALQIEFVALHQKDSAIARSSCH